MWTSDIECWLLDVGYIQLGGRLMMVGQPIHEISSCGVRCLSRFAKTYTCHGKVSIGGVDDMLFEAGTQAECRRQLLAFLLLMPRFADLQTCISAITTCTQTFVIET